MTFDPKCIAHEKGPGYEASTIPNTDIYRKSQLT